MKTWTEQETKILISNYCTTTKSEICQLIPNKSYQGIYKKAKTLGLTRTADAEKNSRIETARRGPQCNLWNGGKMKNDKGYYLLRIPDHHRASCGYVMEHIYVFEKETGIQVPPGCCIHHLNGIKDDNRIENLCLMSKRAHTMFHHIGKKRSEKTRKKISEKQKARLKCPSDHPNHKNVDIVQMQKEIADGNSVVSVCRKYQIDKTTYYSKLRKGDYNHVL